MKRIKHGEVFIAVSIRQQDYPMQYAWITNSIEPEYKDNTLKEHMYSVNIQEAYLNQTNTPLVIPKYIKTFESKLLEISSNLFYFRFTS